MPSSRQGNITSQMDGVNKSPSLRLSGSNKPKFSPKSLYEEIQEDELIALAAIYGDDFKRIASSHGAWNVCSKFRYSKTNHDSSLSRNQSLDLKFESNPQMKILL